MKEFFEIVTLHDCAGCNNKRKITMRDGMGDIIGVIGTVWEALSSLFGGGASSIEKDQFIDALVRVSQAMGFQGFTHGDVVHMMSADWGGAGREAAAAGFDWWLQQLKKYPIGTNVASYVNWPAGWLPSNAIIYTGVNQQPTQAGIFGDSGLMSLLILGGLAFAFLSTPSKTKRKIT